MTDLILRHGEALALLARLYRALDAVDPDTLHACFTSDAIWHRADGPKQGEAAIRSIATDRPPDRKTAHVPSNLVIAEDGDALVGSYYLTVYEEAAGEQPRLLACLDCDDRFAVTPTGLRLTAKRTRVRMKFG